MIVRSKRNFIQVVIATLRESPVGPERRIAPPHDLGRERGIAEVDGQPSVAEGNARDPKPT